MALSENMKGIIFDLDGTLFRLNIDWVRLRRKIESETGLSGSFNEMLQPAAGASGTKAMQLVEEAEIEGVLSGQPIPGVKQALESLKRDYKLAVVTRNGRRSVAAALDALGLSEIVIVAREDVENLKPHPEGIQLALQRFNVTSAESIVVGDTYHDVEAAHNSGMKCIIVRNNELQYIPHGDYNIDSMEELAGLL